MSEFRVDNAVMSRSIKQLVFRPSGKTLWIVIGKDNEHWTDPELGFCSCKHFYFKTLSGGHDCYHLQSVRKAIQEKRYTIVEFADNEYAQILQAIADDQARLLSSS